MPSYRCMKVWTVKTFFFSVHNREEEHLHIPAFKTNAKTIFLFFVCSSHRNFDISEQGAQALSKFC